VNSLLIDLLILLPGTAVLLWLSRKALRHPGGHGFYRFFAWEGILALVVLNRKPWGEQPFSPHQMASWLLMSLSIYLVIRGHRALRDQGLASTERQDGALYEFEKTTTLVTTGIFKHIRHPMYASLLSLPYHFQAPLAGNVRCRRLRCFCCSLQKVMKENVWSISAKPTPPTCKKRGASFPMFISR
jgi:hypothetical protein